MTGRETMSSFKLGLSISLACLLDCPADQDGLCPVVYGDGLHPS